MTIDNVSTDFGSTLACQENEKSISRLRMRSRGTRTLKEKSMTNPQIHPNPPDLLCLSHLRWNFVFQRPQHLMSRFAAERRGFLFGGAPICDPAPRVAMRGCGGGPGLVAPRPPGHTGGGHTVRAGSP